LDKVEKTRKKSQSNDIFINEVHALVDHINECCFWIEENQVQKVKEAFNNSLFKQYLKSCKNLQEELDALVNPFMHGDIHRLIRMYVPKKKAKNHWKKCNPLFVQQTHDLIKDINDCCEWIEANDCNKVKHALDNPLFKRYVKCNEEFQKDMGKAARIKEDEQMWNVLKTYITV
jgi:hypothetical protein